MEVMEERIVEEEEPTVPPVQPVNSFFASLPDEDYIGLLCLYFKFDWRYGTLNLVLA